LQRKGWLRCSSMRRSRMILRTLSDRTTVTRRQQQVPGNPSSWHDAIPPPSARRLTFVFSYVLERECEARVFALDNAHLAKGALADDAQQAEVVEVHCSPFVSSVAVRASVCGVASDGPRAADSDSESGPMTLRTAPRGGQLYAPWSVKTTGLPLLCPMVGYNGRLPRGMRVRYQQGIVGQLQRLRRGCSGELGRRARGRRDKGGGRQVQRAADGRG
jgi:hypothetical protein